MKTINARIKEKRMERGLTLYEVAERLGVKEATVQRYESGSIKNIKHETICKLALIFGCSPEWLMGFDEKPKRKSIEDLYFTTREINLLITFTSNALGFAITNLNHERKKKDCEKIESWLNEASRLNTLLQKLKQWKDQSEQV